MTPPSLFLSIDCESVGLHGSAFAAGWCLVDRNGRELHHGSAACREMAKVGHPEAVAWVKEHVTLPTDAVECPTLRNLRSTFWAAWLAARDMGAVLVADCPWPVEARFLAACVDDDRPARVAHGPYPIIDVASVRLAAGLDPLGTDNRRPGELPAHDPLADARQSARLLIEALGAIDLGRDGYRAESSHPHVPDGLP